MPFSKAPRGLRHWSWTLWPGAGWEGPDAGGKAFTLRGAQRAFRRAASRLKEGERG